MNISKMSEKECREAAANPDTEIKDLVKLSHHRDCLTRMEVAKNPTTPPEILSQLGSNKEHRLEVIINVASNPHTPAETLQELSHISGKDTWYIKCALTKNPSTSIDTLIQLSQDKERAVAEQAAKYLHIRQDSLPLLQENTVSQPKEDTTHEVVQSDVATTDDSNTPAKVDHRLTPEERRERLTTAFNELNAAVENITTGEDWRKYLDFQSKFHQYSARNTMWLQAQAESRGMNLEAVASFNTWKKQGRTVNKGEHGLKVLAPIAYNLKKADLELDPETVERRIKGFKLETVFDVSQTSGPPDTLPTNPMRVTPIVGECDPKIIKAIEQEIEKLGYTIKPTNGELAGWPTTTNGNTMPQAHTVQIRDDLSPAATAKTLTHELAHIVMEHDRSNPQSETEAESTAYLVMNHLGIDSGSYSFGYVSGWAQDTSTVQRSAETIRKTAIELTERIDQHLVPRAQQQKDIADNTNQPRERSEQNTGVRTLVLDHHDLATVAHAGSFAPVLNRPLPSPDTGPELEIDF